MVRTPTLSAHEQEGQSPSGKSRPDLPHDQERCPACGAELAADQEWCLECGAARTQVHRPPDWRIGLTIVLVVIVVVAITAAVLWP